MTLYKQSVLTDKHLLEVWDAERLLCQFSSAAYADTTGRHLWEMWWSQCQQRLTAANEKLAMRECSGQTAPHG